MDVVSPILEKAGAGYVINKLIDVTATYVRDQYYWKTDLQKELQSLEQLLHQIQTVVDFAEGKLTWCEGSNPALMKWFWQFRNEIDEAEEVLDELEYCELEKKANSDKSKAAVLGRLRTCVKNLNTSASGIEKFLALAEKEIPPLSNESRITSALPESSFKGREVEKWKIIYYLLGESGKESEIQISENVHCLPLVAMGGMGKTTLAQQVFDYFENVKKEHFDVKIWVYVSTEFNALNLMKKILEYLTGGSESGSLELLPVKLKEKLDSKRFLLVLDDAWDDKNHPQWEKLHAPLRYGKKGSWILLTTRLNSVAKMVSKVIKGTMKPMMLEGLSDDKCLSLLYEHAFAGGDPNEFPLLKKIGEEIVKKLGGVPLLAKSIGGALNSKLERGHWMSISESEVWKMSPDSKEEFIPALTLSYVMLPPRLKRCFSYCGIFPQGYEFNKQKLVGMWVAAGLIYSDGSEEGSDEDIANRCFDMLCNKSFFDVYTYDWRPFASFYDTAEDFYTMSSARHLSMKQQKTSTIGDIYTMHDMLNGLARHVSRYECCRIVDVPPSSILNYKVIRHISISITSTDAQLHDIANKVCELKHLRTLWIQFDIEDPQKLVAFIRGACKSPRRIRVLIMRCFLSTVSCRSISDFVKLRFLDISSCGQPPSLSLSKSICKFYFLQVLIGNGDFPILAKGTNKLINLRHLYGVKEDALLSVAKVGKLTSLQKLCFSVGTEPGHRIDELMNLNDLHQLKIKRLSNVESHEEANKINLVKKKNLTRLELHYRDGQYGGNDNNSNPSLYQQEVLAALLPPPTIRELFITHYKGGSPAPWMDTSSLSWLGSLELYASTNLEELPPLWKLPCLKFLKLNRMEAIKSLDCRSSNKMDIQFPVLEEVEFVELRLWEEWNGADDYIWFPRLKSFEIVDCPKLKKIPHLPLSIENLKMVDLGLKALPRSYKCSNSSRTFGGFQQLMSLESLEIYNHSKIVQIGSIGKVDDNLLPSSLKKLRLGGILDKHKDLASYLRGLTSLTELNLSDSPARESLPSAIELEYPTALQYLTDSPPQWDPKPLSSDDTFPIIDFSSANPFAKGGWNDSDDTSLIIDFSFTNTFAEGGGNDSGTELLATGYEMDYPVTHRLLAIESLPSAIELEHLTALQYLTISDSKALVSPGGLYIIKSLKHLKIHNCPKFLSAEVESQEFLKDKTGKHAASSSSVFDHSASNKAASILPSSLKSLCISDSDILQESLGRCLQSLTSLRELRLSDCRNLVSLPNIEYLSNLTALLTLNISDCEELRELGSLTALVSLRYLNIMRCPKLLATTFSTLQNPATTREQSATKIKKGTLPALESIDIDNIFYLPILPMPERLKSLYISNPIENSPVPCFPSEIEQWLLQCQESLESLTLQRFPHLQSLPANLKSFSSLRYFNLYFAATLKSLPKMPISLDRLSISGCSAKLKKRCQENIGLDWPNIKHIPYIDITAD